MTTVLLPTLSSNGWIGDVTNKLDTLMSYYYTNNNSQSLLYNNSIFSFQYLVHEYGNNSIEMKNKLSEDLKKYLSAYFDNVDINVVIVNPTSTSTDNTYELKVKIEVLSNETYFSVGEQLIIADGTFKRIANFNNG